MGNFFSRPCGRIRRTDVMECPRRLLPSVRLDAEELDQLAPLLGFLRYELNLPNSAGDPGVTLPPMSASRVLILGSASPALISLLSLLTISTGVFLGADVMAITKWSISASEKRPRFELHGVTIHWKLST
jgi:hypothetical protein